jgi:hypothetical protein
MIEIDLGPLQVAQLAGSQPMPEGKQDHGLVAMRPAIVLAGYSKKLWGPKTAWSKKPWVKNLQ